MISVLLLLCLFVGIGDTLGKFEYEFRSVEARPDEKRCAYSYVMPTLSQPKGVFALFHGCKHDDKDWFQYAEMIRIVQHILQRGYVVVAFKAIASTCWLTMNDARNVDLTHVRASLNAFLSDRRLASLPLYGLGASSGGSFISLFSRFVKFDGIAIMISPGTNDFFYANVGLYRVPNKVAFIYMARDQEWASLAAITKATTSIHKYFPDVDVRYYRVDPVALTADVLTDRLFLSQVEAQAMVDAARQLNFIDVNGFLTENPRQFGPRMVSALTSSFQSPHILGHFRADLGEQLNRLYGGHEMTFDHWPEVMTFITDTRP